MKSYEWLQANVVKVIAGINLMSVLTPDVVYKTKPYVASGIPNSDKFMPCLTSFFDAMSNVKKQLNFIPTITYTTSACHP